MKIYTFDIISNLILIIAIAYSIYVIRKHPELVNIYKYKIVAKYITFALIATMIVSSVEGINNLMSQVHHAGGDSTGLALIIDMFVTVGIPVLVAVIIMINVLIYGMMIGILWIIYAIWHHIYNKRRQYEDKDQILHGQN